MIWKRRRAPSLVDLARKWKPDPAYDYSLGVRDILWEEVPEARAAINALEGVEPGGSPVPVPQDNPYMYFLHIWEALFLPALEAGDLPILRKLMQAFERILAMGSEIVDESFEMMFLKELRRRVDTFGHSYGPLVRQKVLVESP
ncbi:hypothetical protein DQ384_04110 [Sphaerisporangium album]|uniref:Uncharacterized protein n=1 Tax=Sphaerisporangium album TaxID=509200 RepID=A0A367FSW2_9ACTN|nr:hypothetical protein [Sphaerisporangium album]RCG32675.1 hypothetical protein DQ384_04110 [Sphaerisporangium album]